jgi:hypothetical protein
MGHSNGLNWKQANDYCSSLRLSGYPGWRLPTLDEVKVATKIVRVDPGDICPAALPNGCKAEDTVHPGPHNTLEFRGGVDTFDSGVVVWTSTESQTDSTSKWAAQVNTALTPFYAAEMTQASMGVFCVRPMETDLLQVAKAAAVNHPVPDIQTLQTFIPLNKARLAYQSGNYQESITQAQLAISLKADPATANWGIGISYGRLGQWDQAITNLQSALVIDKDFAAAETALKWAKAGQKAAKKGKLPKEPTPKWN